jgi:hypothetical protein
MNNSSSNLTLNSTTTTSNDGIEQLKNLFYEHFSIKLNDYDETNANHLEGLRLDFKTFNDIFFKWIHQLNGNNSNANAASEMFEFNLNANTISLNNANISSNNNERFYIKKRSNNKLNSFSSGIQSSSYFYSKKQQYSKLNGSDSVGGSTYDDEYSLMASSSHSSSSIPSVALSDDDRLNLDSNVLIPSMNEFEQQTLFQQDGDGQNVDLIVEMTSENRQLRQIISDLKVQIQNAEETNSNFERELEMQNLKMDSLSKTNSDLYSKVNAFKEENDYLRRQNEAAKQTTHELAEENSSMSMQLKDLSHRIKIKESEIAKLNALVLQGEQDSVKYMNEFNEQKVSFFCCCCCC